MARKKKPSQNQHTGFRDTQNGKLASFFSFPESCFSGVPYMELHGDATFSITGYESLLLYEETNILFRMKPGQNRDFSLLRVRGHDLTISVLREGCLSICGRIDAVILHQREGDDCGSN